LESQFLQLAMADFKWVGFNKIILHVNRENLQPDTCSIGAQTET